MQLKVKLASAAYNETLKIWYRYWYPDCTRFKYIWSYLFKVTSFSDGDNYAALELWNSTGTKRQFAHKSFPGDEGDFGFIMDRC
jgi:hypothetical protein